MNITITSNLEAINQMPLAFWGKRKNQADLISLRTGISRGKNGRKGKLAEAK